MRESAFLF